jgi:hypothetical protein
MSEPPKLPCTDRVPTSQRLWYADFRDGWVCVDGPDQECFLVLFTSREGALEFFGPTDARGGELPLVLVFSEDEREFLRLAQDALMEGVSGALIHRDGDDQSQTVVRFAAAEHG